MQAKTVSISLSTSEIEWLLRQPSNQYTATIVDQLVHKASTGDFRQEKPVELNGISVWLNPYNPGASLETYVEIFNYKANAGLAELLAPRDSVIVDVGANEGFYTLLVKSLLPRAQVLAVEPDPTAFALLERNVESNGVSGIRLVNCAIADRTGKLRMETAANATLRSSTRMSREPWLRDCNIKRIMVDSLTLADLWKLFELASIDLLKIDVEGMELRLLKAAKAVLPLVRKMDVEYHSETLGRALKQLLLPNYDLMKENMDYGELYLVRKGVGLPTVCQVKKDCRRG